MRALVAALAIASIGAVQGQAHSWKWARSVSTNDPERFREVAIDRTDGSVYAVGEIQNSSLISISGVSLLAQNQALLYKFSEDGTLLWSAVIGGNSEETGDDVAVAADGSVYITGTFISTCHFYHQGGLVSAGSLTSNGNRDIYLAKYSAAGQFLWAQRTGNSNDDLYPVLACDASNVHLMGSFKGNLVIAGSPSAPSLNASVYNLFIARYTHTGALVSMICGGSAGNDVSSNLTSDGTRLIAAYAAGEANVQWYSGNTAIGGITGASTNDHQFAAFNLASGFGFLWGTHVSDPGATAVGYPNAALGCDALYITGGTGPSALLPNGNAATASAGAGSSYIARLDPATGSVQWGQWAVGLTSGSSIRTRDLTVGRNGAIHVVGSFTGQAQVAAALLTGSDADDAMLITIRPSGNVALTDALTGADDQQAWGVAADGLGGVALAGSFENAISIPGNALTGTNNEGAFVAKAQAGVRGPAIMNPSTFLAPAAVCQTSGPIDLTTWLVAQTAGNATAVPITGGASNAMNMIGAPDGAFASIGSAGAGFVVDLGTLIPAGETVVMRWRMNSMSASTASLSFASSSDMADWTTSPSSASTSSTTFAYAAMV
ncbi:MAG: hypothetical protein JNM49_04560, partial [Flavobacteriales bacterium]|nr:hypothetical protein [Flavobacteriales bacterium]